MLSKIHDINAEAVIRISASASIEELEKVKVYYFGKSGILSSYLKKISRITDIENRKSVSSIVNPICNNLKLLIQKQKEKLLQQQIHSKLMQEKIDISLPVRPKLYGKLHPISKVLNEVKQIFFSLGFQLANGPELEDEFHVFDALNTPKHHPSRNENDTFYLAQKINNKRIVLRTHTSSVQIRTMECNTSFPIKIIAPGKVYRNDWDAEHSPMFHQIEGLYVDHNINMGHLKYCINYFLSHFFNANVKTRFRNSFFPFTEPSAEVDIQKDNQDWIEILGCGMVHRNILKNVNIDPNKYSGFAFGIGIERIAMLKYNIEDLRMFYENKLQWINHYGFNFTDVVK
ncbi:phenylalanine--tRNA ligase subunit alpha [Neoehrlichia mikurensis]|uniref:Phenylalanine--tRNA ligase alpha subunit n=1 Tax=Neoehrlichia mikurensis TaxID=89586 RepID=A0A9Q9BW28_9RICK|nr:phenylalanine--tRNA ligase subunit alpha [Neoehrlichia mikurensis]QXK92211.1 phenylalanine--tRNA ligase subunit alpha [Neoehrlichia mikurensis]QXK92667.1 phenylalanine--tRNA ligase subunit alpha [Neoehrlichia mikurensis]QXK93904.1 phenylalanine--tRNA ligase subunit alpha [Neoehrlichia mikurensis]UTO55096.1 phenylalanine--tRNA ligase subunit alpha [Neoehrlichia mikurensis]UTO56015.1 phenylalanine--tRNA ligase subunit alpha [Neoehrlichia mikurensis]